MAGKREIDAASVGAEDADTNELAIDLDSRTLHLLTAVERALSEHRWLHGSMRATQIGDGVRREMGIPATDLAGPEATEYLERVIRALESDAARSAKHGWGRYRTLWYLRRLPYKLFSFGDEFVDHGPLRPSAGGGRRGPWRRPERDSQEVGRYGQLPNRRQRGPKVG